MDDLNSHEDLEEHMNTFALFIKQYHGIQTAQEELKILLNKLTQEVETLKKSKLKLIQQVQIASGSTETQESVSTLCSYLKENYNNFQDKYNEFLKENVLLQENHITEKTEVQEKFMLEKIKITETLTAQINALKIKNEHQRDEFLKREFELYNELKLAQASNALRCDEMESHVQSLQIQLGESNQTCNVLREEYSNFKLRSNYEIDVANKRINDLQKLLQHTEQQLNVTQEQLFNATNQKTFTTDTTNATLNMPETETGVQLKIKPTTYKSPRVDNSANTNIKSGKYDSLGINVVTASKNAGSGSYSCQQYQDDGFVPPNRREESMHSSTSKQGFSVRNKSIMSALKQLSKSTHKPASSKKIKLYNPRNLDFLNGINRSN